MMVGSNSGAGNSDGVEIGTPPVSAVLVEAGVSGFVSAGVIELVAVLSITTVGVDVSLGFT